MVGNDGLLETMMLCLERGEDFGTEAESIATGMTCLIYLSVDLVD